MNHRNIDLKSIVLALFTIVLQTVEPSFLQAQGKVLETLKFNSKILDKEIEYSVYLPVDYETSDRNYPVVYLLHGQGGDETVWVQYGEVNRIADDAIATGKIAPMIIVMPDGGVNMYINDYKGKVRYEDMFIQEFMPYIEKTYRSKPEKRFRAIIGNSMGGYGAMNYAIKYPDLFAACVPLSAGIITDNQLLNSFMSVRLRPLVQNIFGMDFSSSDPINDHWKSHHPIHMVSNAKPEDLKKVRYFFDCGDDDFLYEGNSTMHILLRNLQIPHEFRIRDGGHSWTYWRSGILDALEFVGESFRKDVDP